jgi:chromosome segregation ATPase
MMQTMPTEGPEHLGAAMTLLNAKSQEIAKLDTLLAAEQAKSGGLSQEVESLRAALVAATSEPRSEEVDLELQLSEARALVVQEKAAWDAERSKLTSSVETLTREKADAQKNGDFFREQYGKASGFVSSVRRENDELENRTRIAEEQTTTGVALVKATFQKHIEKLEEDAKKWRVMAMFVIEKDQRTNDDIRRRAAEEPELRARCESLEEHIDALDDQTSNLESELERKETTVQQLEKEVSAYKKEITRLNIELNEAQSKFERSSKAGEGSQSDHEMLYRCQWRPEGGNDPCEGLFVSVEVRL